MLAANVFWPVTYDTEYAMVDRDDDIKIGIRTSALTFGRVDVLAIMLCDAVTPGIFVWIGVALDFGWRYWIGWAAAVACAIYHDTLLIKNRERTPCFAAFNMTTGSAACCSPASQQVTYSLGDRGIDICSQNI